LNILSIEGVILIPKNPTLNTQIAVNLKINNISIFTSPLQLFNLLQPSFRMLLAIVQIQFICKLDKLSPTDIIDINEILSSISVLNTNDLEMGSHKVISRFGLMHMVRL